ncbi:MAG: ABC transporter ATP-binding protein [Bradymonadales bacterium]|nr:ABC transporter ATP-binding protein [Bradymonadales bacterium]
MIDSNGHLIEIKNLTRTYRQGIVEVPALKGVDLTIDRGEFTALYGPSGSGKTTLLNLIGCLDRPDQGSIAIGGRRVEQLSRSAAATFRLNHIGFVFQAYNLIPVLTACENAEFILLLQGVPRQQRRAVVHPLLERVGLAGEMNRKPHELSGGQQQRVAVVRAIASNSRIVLADEPTANLDAETARELIRLMLELNEEQGVTFLFSTHDPTVLAHAHRLIEIRSGRINGERSRLTS